MKSILVLLKVINTSLSSISLQSLFYQTIHRIYFIFHIILSFHTLSHLFLSSQILFYTKHTLYEFQNVTTNNQPNMTRAV